MKILKTTGRVIASPIVLLGLSILAIIGSAIVTFEYVKSGKLLND